MTSPLRGYPSFESVAPQLASTVAAPVVKRQSIWHKLLRSPRFILGSLGLLFLVVGAASALVLSQIGQDVRQQASGGTGYGTCYFGVGACSALGRYPAAECTSCPQGAGVCCGSLFTEEIRECTPNVTTCENGMVKTCKADGAGYIETACASGTECRPGTNRCLAPTDAEPGGECLFGPTSCGAAGRYPASGCGDACPAGVGVCCGGAIPDDKKVCDPGAFRCENNTQYLCNSGGTGETKTACADGWGCVGNFCTNLQTGENAGVGGATNEGQCLAGKSSCASEGRYPSDKCGNSCPSAVGVCCGIAVPTEAQVCTPNEVSCANDKTVFVCNGNGLIKQETRCAYGTFCLNGACITEESQVADAATSQCFFGAATCSSLGRYPGSGCGASCPAGAAACCGKPFEQNVSRCLPNTTICAGTASFQMCSPDGTHWREPVSCVNGFQCFEGRCQDPTAGKPVGQACSVNADCASGRCARDTDGTRACQPPLKLTCWNRVGTTTTCSSEEKENSCGGLWISQQACVTAATIAKEKELAEAPESQVLFCSIQTLGATQCSLGYKQICGLSGWESTNERCGAAFIATACTLGGFACDRDLGVNYECVTLSNGQTGLRSQGEGSCATNQQLAAAAVENSDFWADPTQQIIDDFNFLAYYRGGQLENNDNEIAEAWITADIFLLGTLTYYGDQQADANQAGLGTWDNQRVAASIPLGVVITAYLAGPIASAMPEINAASAFIYVAGQSATVKATGAVTATVTAVTTWLSQTPVGQQAQSLYANTAATISPYVSPVLNTAQQIAGSETPILGGSIGYNTVGVLGGAAGAISMSQTGVPIIDPNISKNYVNSFADDFLSPAFSTTTQYGAAPTALSGTPATVVKTVNNANTVFEYLTGEDGIESIPTDVNGLYSKAYGSLIP